MTSSPLLTMAPNRRILNKHFVSELVSESVTEFSISAGSKHGDNVMGKLLSLDVKTASNDIHHLVLKSVLPMTGLIDKNILTDGEFMVGLHAFPIEILFYRDILPIFQEVTKKHPRFTLFSRPKYYSSFCSEENGLYDYIALEDLRPSGYKMLDKYKGLNLEQAGATLKQLAVFHAVSYCLLNGKTANNKFCEYRNDPKCFLNTHCWDKRAHPIADHELLFNGLIIGMTDVIRDDLGQVDAASKIKKKFGTTGYQNLIGLWEKTGKEDKYFPVLIHADFWTNNILYKLAPDGISVEDIKFIDFQSVRFGNIYEELQYFLFTSTTAEFRKTNLSSCLQIYFDEFSKVVEEMGGCPMPKGFSVEQLINTFEENRDYGSAYNLVALPFQLGITPPPPSPMSPIEVKLSAEVSNGNMNGNENKFFPPKEEETEEKTDFNKIGAELTVGYIDGVRNSPVAKVWLRQLLDEMIEHEVI